MVGAQSFTFGVLAISTQDATARLINFARSQKSGFTLFDRAGMAARASGRLDEVGPWTLSLAVTLNGRVSIPALNNLLAEIPLFAQRLHAVPQGVDLHLLDPSALGNVKDFCTFQVKGALAPLVTKVGALFRPHAVPVLDSETALAYGLKRSAFSTRGNSRISSIHRVIDQRREELGGQSALLELVRQQAAQAVPDIGDLTLLRVSDIIVWASMVDKTTKTNDPKKTWAGANLQTNSGLRVQWCPV